MTTETTSMATRTCIGSKTFGIESHEAAIEDFPVQPSRRDGLGTMCRPHWTEYTRALRRAAVAKGPQADEFQAAVDETSRIVQRDARRAKAARVAPEPARPASESAAVKSRRAKLEAALAAAGGAGTEAGQQILEDADVARASGLLLAMSEPLTVEETSIA